MPRGVPTSAREAEKGATACAEAARLPGSRLLPRLIEPATELARRMPPFPSRLELPSPDKSSAVRAEFRLFENEPSFELLSVLAPMELLKEFDLFSSAVTVP